MNLSKGFAFIGLVFLLLLTYFRENFLLAINASMALEEYNRSYFYWFSDFFQKMDSERLIFWKWGLTIVFSLVMSMVTIGSLYVWFRSVKMMKISVIIYLVFFSLVCLLMFTGYLADNFNGVYFASRKILGIIQSPLPFFTFFTLFYWSFRYK